LEFEAMKDNCLAAGVYWNLPAVGPPHVRPAHCRGKSLTRTLAEFDEEMHVQILGHVLPGNVDNSLCPSRHGQSSADPNQKRDPDHFAQDDLRQIEGHDEEREYEQRRNAALIKVFLFRRP